MDLSDQAHASKRGSGVRALKVYLTCATDLMDLKTLKLELLERIADLEDEARLLDLKRLLHLPAVPVGGPPSYVLPGVRYVADHLSIEREGQTPYLKLEDRMYTAEEVRKLVGEVRLADTMDDDADLAPD